MRTRTILVLGGNGFLGSSLVRRFHSRGDRVAVLGRRGASVSRIEDLLSDVAWFELGAESIDAPFSALGHVDAVFMAAAAFGRRGESPQVMLETKTLLPLRLLCTALQHGTSVVINADTALRRHPSAYALSKRHFSEWGRLLSDGAGIRFINARLEHLYGPGDDEGKFPALVIRTLLRNESVLTLTRGDQQRDFVFIEDVCDAYEVLLGAASELEPGFHEYSIGSGHSMPIRDFVDAVRRMTGSHTEPQFGALAYRPHEVMQSEAQLSAMRSLGWTPRTELSEGLRTTIDIERKTCGC